VQRADRARVFAGLRAARRLLMGAGNMHPSENPYGLERPSFPPSGPVVRAIPSARRAVRAPAAGTAPGTTRWLLGAVIAASAAAVIVGILASSWFTARGSSAGLLGVETCRRGACVTTSWSDSPAPLEVALFAAIALVGALASIIMAGIVTALVFARRNARIPYRIVNGALGLAAFGSVAFMTRLSGELVKGLSIGYAGFVMFAGLAGLAVATRFLVRR
jgi:hypothetical protein